MIDDGKAARSTSSDSTSWRDVERTRSCKATQDAVIAQMLEGLLTDGQQALDFITRRARIFGIVHTHRRRAENRDGTMRYEDIAVRRFVQAIDDVVADALVECNQRSFVRLHANIQSRELGHLASPAACDIDKDITGDFRDEPREGVARAYALDLAVLRDDAHDFLVCLSSAAITSRTIDILPGEAETIYCCIRDHVGRNDVL